MPAGPAEAPTLSGRLVRLEPLSLEHAAALLATISDREVWRWKLAPYPETEAEMRQLIATTLMGPTQGRMPFAIRRISDGAVIGSTSLYDLDWRQERTEMGWTWLDRRCWGQGYNEDSKYLLLRQCFEVWDLKRVAWRLDSLNLRSKKALERCGFVYEGQLRSHLRRPDGSRRDSLYYSLLPEEWPLVGPHLLELVEQRSKGSSESS